MIITGVASLYLIVSVKYKSNCILSLIYIKFTYVMTNETHANPNAKCNPIGNK